MEYENRVVLIANTGHKLFHSFKQQLAGLQKGFSIIAVNNGDKVVEKLAQDDISLVVTDLNIPNTDGFGLLYHIAEFYPDIPVIVIIEYSDSEMESLILEAGAVGCIKRPFKADELIELASDWLQREVDGGILRNVSPGMFCSLLKWNRKRALSV